MLESSEVPAQQPLVAFVRKGITGLGATSIERVKVYVNCGFHHLWNLRTGELIRTFNASSFGPAVTYKLQQFETLF